MFHRTMGLSPKAAWRALFIVLLLLALCGPEASAQGQVFTVTAPSVCDWITECSTSL